MQTGKVRVLIVDDSAVVRSILKSAITQHPALEVVGVAEDGVEALRQISALRPDVVTLDVEMPNLNGLEVLERVGGKLPVSFVMCSSLTQVGARTTFEALHKGAFDYVPKPHQGIARDDEFRTQLHAKILAAARAKGRIRRVLGSAVAGSPAVNRLPPNRARGWVVGIGVSCGGPQALHTVLPAFPSDFVPILVTQHMPPQFTPSFAQHLDSVCAMRVREACDGMPLARGTILIAPGSHHVRVVRRGASVCVQLDAGPKVAGHRPSVDVMLASLARVCGARCVGIIMTGMGHDGAEGLKALYAIGAPTIAQDEESSLVYGMPKAAVAAGCVSRSVALTQIPQAVAAMLDSPAGVAPGAAR